MAIEAMALFFYILLVLLGIITIWLSFPGTMLVIGGAIVYDLFVRSNNLPWQAYIEMFSILAIAEILDIILISYMKKSQLTVNVIKTIAALGMIAVFVFTL